ncbi:MAG: hypothetical protein ACRCXL_03360 [Dermatophilaceae bacterium]
MLLHKVNSDESLRQALQAGAPASGVAPVMATPAALVVAAKVAGYAVGGGAVTGAAYAAYRTVAQ